MSNILFSEYNFFKVNFIDPASPLMYGIIELHDHIFFFLNMVLFLVLFLLVTTLRYFSYKKNSRLNRYLLSQATKPQYEWLKLSHGTNIEIIWTVVPSLILILIAIPSFALLYATDELVDPSVTIQVIGHQWYWSYEYNDLVTLSDIGIPAPTVLTWGSKAPILFHPKVHAQIVGSPFSDLDKFLYRPLTEFVTGTVEFDSYMRQESDLQPGELRLYETDFPLVLPKFTHIRFMITADDVIHSWSVPALGIKVDAVPGRINHAHTYIKYSGIFYGQCSELCGVNHAFMPIQILVFEPQLYYDYLRLLVLSK
jgi:cytochrome c oxidase subunit 2